MSPQPQQTVKTPPLQDQRLHSSLSDEYQEAKTTIDRKSANDPPSTHSFLPEPFPELDEDLDSELADLSPAFAHEAGSGSALDTLTLPGPAEADGTDEDRRSMFPVSRSSGHEENTFDSEGMREATQRGLEWARMMFGKEASGGDGTQEMSEAEQRNEQTK